jgi:hypothetical protein
MEVLVLLLLLLAAVLTFLGGCRVATPRVDLGWFGVCAFVLAVLAGHIKL